MGKGLQSIDAIVSRSTLRDVVNRLKRIRQTCGANDDVEGKEGTGDAFKDKMVAFQKLVKETREMMTERTAEKRKGNLAAAEIATKNHEINLKMRDLRAEVNALHQLAEAAVADVARTNKKIAKAGEKVSDERRAKLQSREKIAKERQNGVQACREIMKSLESIDDEKNMTAKEAKNAAGVAPGGKRAPKLRETVAERQARLKRAAARQKSGDEEEAAPAKRLEDDPETKQYMADLAEKDRLQEAALTRIQAQMGRITECAVAIGQELDNQANMLKDTEAQMDKATKDLKGINKGLTKLMKDQKPMNMIINVVCFLLILGLVGFFLSEFGVI